jgi:Tol biopolymer transport system component
MITFSARQWEGQYWSKDIPNGVATTPYTSAVWVVPEDGSAPARQVISLAGRGDHSSFSPDGQWLYFQAPPGGPESAIYHIYRCRPDGTDLLDLTATHSPAGSRFGYRQSRDGSRLLFTYFDGQIGRVGIMLPDGSQPYLIAPDIGYHYMADLSADNQQVVFAHTAKGYILTLKHLITGDLTVLTPGHKDCYAPQFTPDGKTIVFIRRDEEIYRMGSDGQGFQRLTEGNRYSHFTLSPEDRHGSTDSPTLSPDGQWITYIARRAGIPQVHVMRLDGSEQRQVTFRPTPCGRATFGADGKTLAFVSWEGPYTQLFTVLFAGGEARQLTEVQGAVCSLHWGPPLATKG